MIIGKPPELSFGGFLLRRESKGFPDAVCSCNLRLSYVKD
jgi:hypothetical protein